MAIQPTTRTRRRRLATGAIAALSLGTTAVGLTGTGTAAAGPFPGPAIAGPQITLPRPELPEIGPILFRYVDLTSTVRTGAPYVVRIGGTDYVRIPVTVTVTNNGTVRSGPSKVAAHHRQNGRPEFVAALSRTPGPGTGWYVHIPGVPPGGSFTFNGRVTLVRSYVDDAATTELRVEADSCSGEEFTPSWCAVSEIDETNNFSPARTVVLP